MRRLPKPNEDLVALLRLCAASYSRNHDRCVRLLNSEAGVVHAATSYETAATSTTLHALPKTRDVAGAGTATAADMVDAYDVKMARIDAVAREVYDRIKGASVRCPLCGAREVRQLDHHLPKTKYPSYALLPANLVPSCTDCNDDKLAASPMNSGEETIHPYFDDFASERWLHAQVKEEQPPVITYSVLAPATWSLQKATRAHHHLHTFKLHAYFSKMAAVLLGDIREQLLSQAHIGGAGAIKAHLRETADSRRRNQLNHWEVAAYDAMAASDWFCTSGYLYVRTA